MSVHAPRNPTLSRILSSNALPDLRLGDAYNILKREPGAVKAGIPIFAMSEALSFQGLQSGQSKADGMSDGLQESTAQAMAKVIPGARVLPNVLSQSECDQLIKLTESAGYDEDAPTRLGRHVRKNENCVVLASEAFNNMLFERCRAGLPSRSCGGVLCGINRRWRFYKYHPGDIFRAHIDPGGWTGSGIDESGELIPDCFGDRVSQMTLLIYLNDDFVGGATRFFIDPVRPHLGHVENCDQIVSVPPQRGAALCFFHGNHPMSPWHEGGVIQSGTKYVLRTDVLYKFK